MEVTLVMFLSDGTRRDFPIQKESAIIGRAHGSDLRIPLSSVSRQHCELRVAGDKLTVRDLGSSNGTYHNSIRIQEATLKAGDEMVIGPVVFIVVVDGHPDHIEPVRTLVETKAPSKISPAIETGGSDKDDDLELQPIALNDDDKSLPEVENESHTPTVDLDDPLAALQALTQNRNEDETESVFPLPNDDEDDKKSSIKKK